MGGCVKTRVQLVAVFQQISTAGGLCQNSGSPAGCLSKLGFIWWVANSGFNWWVANCLKLGFKVVTGPLLFVKIRLQLVGGKLLEN